MAPTQALSIPAVGFGFLPRKSSGPTARTIAAAAAANKPHSHNQNWGVRSKMGDHQRPPKSTVDVERLVEFLYEDLHHVFDEQGIDRTAYDEEMRFRDPITKYDNITGYLLNIALLHHFFRPKMILHWTGPYEITTRWTAVMKFMVLPWKPEFVVTGTSIMGINPHTGKFCSHVDLWDSVQNNDYFSIEGLWDVFKQIRFYETPELESPKYQILKRTANYEVRKYEPSIVAEISGENLCGCAYARFDRVGSWANCKEDTTKNLRKNEGGIAAVLKFSGKSTKDEVQNKAKQLRHSLKKDGLKPINNSSLLARYNNSYPTWSFVMRNEVLIWLEDFSI
ncbi:uncharacterized protein LOC120071584 isoform X2 [Benincasa hispida]|uniref:uncharacterized protein LOC120071584 isoform X2 n=1 Tax=Benincasa hispida TaxID=102211 RepID=UPI00190107E4|nr:uncharacterized protein LOC120071584 isoform X2 [Benincasa hispida]